MYWQPPEYLPKWNALSQVDVSMKTKQHLYHDFCQHNSSDYNMEISKFRLQLWNWQHWRYSQDELLPGWVTLLAKPAGHFRCVAGTALAAAAASFLLAK